MATYELRDPQNNLVNTILLDDPSAWPVPDGHTLIRVPDLEPTPETPKTDKERALADLASIRYARETGGILVGGSRIATDRESQALITGAHTYSQLDPKALIDWKGVDGTWTKIDAATIAVIARAVAAHVQACFSNERALSELIDAAETVDDLASIDLESGWPL